MPITRAIMTTRMTHMSTLLEVLVNPPRLEPENHSFRDRGIKVNLQGGRAMERQSAVGRTGLGDVGSEAQAGICRQPKMRERLPRARGRVQASAELAAVNPFVSAPLPCPRAILHDRIR